MIPFVLFALGAGLYARAWWLMRNNEPGGAMTRQVLFLVGTGIALAFTGLGYMLGEGQ